ncbi:MAG: allophycocyanin [Gemmatimonadaceae bacterium]|nr:allophycocyanin [Gloeobacterales cyanobacterium ES-bin-141]
MSVVLNAIKSADEQLRYLTTGELDAVRNFIDTSNMRLKVAQTLSEASEKVVKGAGEQLFQKRPDFIAPGGNAYGEKRTASCLRDLNWYYRLITYSIVAGNTDPVETIGLVGITEMYRILEVPIPGMIESVRLMRQGALALLSPDEAEVAAPYFDYVIGAMQS